jgi:alpha-beta hydrolase superfamily lysophospholipase
VRQVIQEGADLALDGLAVYMMDVRGFGASTRPASMSLPIDKAPPAVPAPEAVRDIGAVVNWVRERDAAIAI